MTRSTATAEMPNTPQAPSSGVAPSTAEAAEARAALREFDVALTAARAARQTGDHAAALAHFEVALGIMPEHDQAIVECAEELRVLRRLDDAEAMVTDLLARRPRFAAIFMVLGRCARARGNDSAALQNFATAADCWPDYWSLFELGQEQRRAGALSAALESFARASRGNPDQTGALFASVSIHRELGDLHVAREGAHALEEHLSGDPGLWNQLGLIERADSNAAAALAAFERAHALDPTNVDTLLNMAAEHRALGRRERAQALFVQASKLKPDNAHVLNQCAQQALQAEDNLAALALFQQARAVSPGDVHLTVGAAEAMTRLGHVADAIALLDEAAARLGSLPALVTKRTALRFATGEPDGTLEAVRDQLSAWPQNTALLGAIGQQLPLIATPAEVEALLEPVDISQDRARAFVLGVRAALAESRGDVPSAIDLHRQAAALRSNDPGAFMTLARLSLLVFDFDGAVEHLRRNRALTAPLNRLLNRSANLSQTRIGRMLNEYRLDGQVHDAVLAAQALEASERRAALQAAVQQYPDSTLAAVALIDSLVHQGAFDRPFAEPTAGAKRLIPAHVVQFWEQGVPPADVAVLMRSWSGVDPAAAYSCFSDAQARAFIAAEHATEVAAAYGRIGKPAQRADLFRLAYLARHGGVYAAPDDRCIATLDRLIGPDDALVLYRGEFGTLENNFFACAPGHPMIRTALDWAVIAINRGDSDLLWLSTGPGVVTRAFAAAIAAGGDALIAQTRLLSRRDVYRAVAPHCRTGTRKPERVYRLQRPAA